MSTEQGSSRPEDKAEGLSKYIKRMRTVLSRNSTSKTPSSMQETTSTGEPGQAEASKPAKPTTEPTPQQKPQKQKQKPTQSQQQPTTDATAVSHWSTVQQEKARALFAKYGLTLEPGEWKSPSDMTVQRVSKPIRMRVRRTCHRCQTTFGPDRICVSCQHVRCKKCPRHPPPKSKPEMTTTSGGGGGGGARTRAPGERRSREAAHSHSHSHAHAHAHDHARVPPVVAPHRKTRELPEITLPSQTGGQDLVRRLVLQRVRRTCHRCNASFPTPEATQCIDCGHLRCKSCPRDPPKLRKYPDGYPGDVEPPLEMPQRSWRKPRHRVRYTCHLCSTLYRSGERHCSGCGQEKGPHSIRDPPRRVRPESNPETVRRVQERLALVDIGHI